MLCDSFHGLPSHKEWSLENIGRWYQPTPGDVRTVPSIHPPTELAKGFLSEERAQMLLSWHQCKPGREDRFWGFSVQLSGAMIDSEGKYVR